VIADRVMPHLPGTELAQRMQENPQLKSIPLILVTGIAEKEEVIEGIKAGARDFLYKPVEKDLLLAIVKKYYT
jgi:FixJ family two-component response regulator